MWACLSLRAPGILAQPIRASEATTAGAADATGTSGRWKSRRAVRELDGLLVAGDLALMLAPPDWQALEQAERLLRVLVERHLVLVLAALLGEGADALVDPLVAVDLLSLLRLGSGRRRDDGVDAGLLVR